MTADQKEGFIYPPEAELTDADFYVMQQHMNRLGTRLKAADPHAEVIFQGAGDVGSIQTSSDVDNSRFLLGLSRPKFRGSFSEEDDPQDEHGRYLRLRDDFIRQGLWMFDPVDGSGDRIYGEPGTPERNGYSILASHLRDGEVQASIVVRPEFDYSRILTFKDGKVFAHNSSSFFWRQDGQAIIQGHDVTDSSRLAVQDRDIQRGVIRSAKEVRVNVRDAYSDVNFPPDFWKFAQKETGIKFVPVRRGGAGDSLSELVLGGLDLVVARKGDWKAWDTGPFDPMIRTLGGKLTDCDNNPLEGYNRPDLWHHRGVVASIGEKGMRAHDALIGAMDLYKKQHKRDLVIETPPRPLSSGLIIARR
jgi:3'-phosphoadenosine 5'-phosphosulfate (PAPS) 3'-phosphatase